MKGPIHDFVKTFDNFMIIECLLPEKLLNNSRRNTRLCGQFHVQFSCAQATVSTDGLGRGSRT